MKSHALVQDIGQAVLLVDCGPNQILKIFNVRVRLCHWKQVDNILGNFLCIAGAIDIHYIAAAISA
ncbi:hypothetical protein FRIGORI9N_470034 [Frigoribacterium sp. 9N]|nr:hypothetical protein FRIGORI9N_470034 [Frigoribacterium sp. 9N]